ncbi:MULTISPECIES: hypothetical protein [unclassified Methanosarcina]|uniref:hypothetical protein n=1 Tax=unclassified Methanosarcina TaxID=2644672 RepID=UPI0006161BDF|nr:MULTISPECIES: hypothetical protein [unclassified Methanosarcina]AKB18689.1 hypothetical protein MSWHS_1826 [Methanosarcina sp. WWM596]AKB21778.1 hypothetical protein MSWH1_1507 [Methanosarcina sp. WH1]
MTILTAMNSSKSEDSVLPSHISDHAARENSEKPPAWQSTCIYESSTFSSPDLDQLRGLLPDFNNRLSPTRDLGLSPLGHSRLSSEALPRLASDAALGLVSGTLPGPLSGLKTETSEKPVGRGLEIMPDLPGRTLAGNKVGSLTLGADLPMGFIESRLLTLRPADMETKEK